MKIFSQLACFVVVLTMLIGCASAPEKEALNLADTSPSSASSASDRDVSTRNTVALDGDVSSRQTDVSASRTLSSASTLTQKLFDVQSNNAADRMQAMLGADAFQKLVAMLENPDTVSEVAPIVTAYIEAAGKASAAAPAIHFDAPIESTQISLGSGNVGGDVRPISKEEAEAIKEVSDIIREAGERSAANNPDQPVDPDPNPAEPTEPDPTPTVD